MTVDLTSAVILGAVVLGLVSMARTALNGATKDRLTVVIVLVVSIVAVLLVAASDFGSTQVILSRSLDKMNFWSQLVVGVLLAGLGSGGWEALRAVKNIGDNQSAPTSSLPPPSQPPSAPK